MMIVYQRRDYRARSEGGGGGAVRIVCAGTLTVSGTVNCQGGRGGTVSGFLAGGVGQ